MFVLRGFAFRFGLEVKARASVRVRSKVKGNVVGRVGVRVRAWCKVKV